jgi:hypothetical protein
MSDNTLPDIGEKYLRNPVLLQTPEGDDYTDETPAKWAWFSHGYDTGMEPFYSAGQLKEAMEAAWTASRCQALEEAALICDEEAKDSHRMARLDNNARYDHMEDAANMCAASIRRAGKES